ncbi:MAG: hypothetical protein BroJett018_20990 [Chloroflexota bacterium]|nr:tetratricopeptide repeat protein [Chloroflexota bacterium]NOG65392.1 tetratricopeptide repeat protein [Chloroflexota bacterium]GIK64305.1 MAG: hypothetical protein BroJett018_20990 [Chloroflexota bacterium]
MKLDDSETIQDLEEMLSAYLKQIQILRAEQINTTKFLQEKGALLQGIWAASCDAIAYPRLYPIIVELYDILHYPVHTLGLWSQIKKFYEEIGLKAALGSAQFRYAGRFLTYIGVIKANQDDPTGALDYLNQAAELLTKITDDPKAREDHGAVLFHLCSALNDLGRYAEVIETGKVALQVCRAIGRWDTEAFTLGQIGNAYARLGNFAKAEELYLQTAEIWEAHPEKGYLRHITYYHLGRINLIKSNYKKAREFLRQSIEIKQEVGELKEGLAHCTVQLGIACAKLGDYQEALYNFDSVNRIIKEELFDVRAMAELGYGYALVAIGQQKYSEGFLLLQSALAQIGQQRFPDLKIQLALYLAKLALFRINLKMLRYAFHSLVEVLLEQPSISLTASRFIFKR